MFEEDGEGGDEESHDEHLGVYVELEMRVVVECDFLRELSLRGLRRVFVERRRVWLRRRVLRTGLCRSPHGYITLAPFDRSKIPSSFFQTLPLLERLIVVWSRNTIGPRDHTSRGGKGRVLEEAAADTRSNTKYG